MPAFSVGFLMPERYPSMQLIRTPADAATIADTELRALVQKTIAALSEDYPYDPDALGKIITVQSGDSLDAINELIGFDILTNKWSGVRFDQPGYTQAFEILDEHAGYYELVFLIDDSGYGIELFIPKILDIPELLAMCQRYATPASGAV
jgi:hypothetical protein